MPKNPFESPKLYFNRELSWLEFNDRVLREGLSENLPLLERLKFLAIVSSNLDEFFLIRVAGLMQQRSAGVRRRDRSGMTPVEQLAAISRRAHRMVVEQTEGIRKALRRLAKKGIHVVGPKDWTPQQRQFLQGYFSRQIMPILTPLAVEELDPAPLLPGLQLYTAAVIAPSAGEKIEKKKAAKKSAKKVAKKNEKIVVVPVPSQLPRFITMPADDGNGDVHLAMLEDVIAGNVAMLFPGCEAPATAQFRITRDADVTMLDDDADDLLQSVEDAVLERRRRAAVHLAVSADPDRRIKKWLVDRLQLRRDDVYEIDGMLDATALWEIVERPGFDKLKTPQWPPQPAGDLIGSEDIWSTLQDRDVMLFHPYESFDPVVRLVEQAAEDPQVLAVKQTLYRTSGDSPIIRALESAATNGKEVTVLVELRARFDEARNVGWARRLEDAGCHVIYGVVGLKTHAKALLIVRREANRICRYVHLATGNYNDKTARLYSDIGLMTFDRDIATDVAAFFNLLTGYSETVGWSKFSIAPTGLKQRFIDLIDREVSAATTDRPGFIMAKTNSLQDPEIIQALYRASRAGVKIKLNVRGICCLKPGVKGVSENIEVRSIIDRFLEHARIFYFSNGGHEEVYLSSADWMQRNLVDRLEILFPVTDANLRRRLVDMLKVFFADNVKASVLQSDGAYKPVVRKGRAVRAQEKFYKDAVEAVRTAEQTTMQFQPLKRPKE